MMSSPRSRSTSVARAHQLRRLAPDPYSVRYGSTSSNDRQTARTVSARPPVADHHRRVARRPLLLDPAHDAVDRLRGAEHHPGADALLRARADDARWARRAPSPAASRCGGTASRPTPHAGRDHAAEEHAVRGDAVEGGRRAEVDDDRVAPVAAARGERVDDPVGADGERLVDVERDRQRRARIDDLDARAPGATRGTRPRAAR